MRQTASPVAFYGECQDCHERNERDLAARMSAVPAVAPDHYEDGSAFQPVIDRAKQTMWTSQDVPHIDERTLGTLVARWADWDVWVVTRVCMAALEDANCHTECAALYEAAVKMGMPRE